MPVPANLVHEESVTTGTGDLTLTAVNGKQRFAAAFTTAGTDVFDYFISNRDAAEWERGTGSAPTTNTLRRDSCLETNAGSTVRISFSAGTKDVTNDIPAASQIHSTATAANYRANTTSNLGLTPNSVWTAAGSVALSAATSAVTVDMSSFLTIATLAMATDHTLANPTSPKVGQHYIVSVSSTTNRSLALGTNYKRWTGVEAPPYAVTTGEKLYVCGFVESSTGVMVTAVGRTTAVT
jgi:hypothetical protein